jgi:hypothetical protein
MESGALRCSIRIPAFVCQLLVFGTGITIATADLPRYTPRHCVDDVRLGLPLYPQSSKPVVSASQLIYLAAL